MDHAMHELWMKAERRIDGALAGLAACAGWLIAIVLTVMLTDLEWTGNVVILALVVIPLATVFVRPLYSGLQVARAIEQRDADELARWRETGIPLRYPELLRARLTRVHYPMLIVVSVIGIYIAGLALVRAITSHSWVSLTYSAGFVLMGVGIALGGFVLTRAERLTPRDVLARLVATSWTVPVGLGLCSWAMIGGRVEISSGTSESYSSVVFAVFGVLVALVAIALAVVWLGWWGRVMSGRGLHRKNSLVSRAEQEELDRFAEEKEQYSGSTGETPLATGYLNTAEWSLQLVGLSPEETEATGVDEFDANDVQIIEKALGSSLLHHLASGLVVLASLAMIVVSVADIGGAAARGVVGVVMMLAMVAVVSQARTVRES